MVGPELGGVLDQDQPLGRVDQGEQGGEQRGLAAAGPAADQERHPGGDERAQQLGAVAGERAGRDQLVEGEGPGRRHAQRDRRCPAATPARARRGSGCRPAAGGRRTAPRRRAAGRPARPAAGPAGARRRRSANRTAGRLEPLAAVDEDLVGAVDQDVGDAGQPEQRLERPGAEDVATQGLVDREHRGVADGAAGLAQRLGHAVRAELAGPVGQAGADPVDDLRLDLGRPGAHAATDPGASAASTSRPAAASGPRRDRTGPSPRSSASARPRWSAIAARTGSADQLGHPPRVGAGAAHDQPAPARGRAPRPPTARPRPRPVTVGSTTTRDQRAAGQRLDHQGVDASGAGRSPRCRDRAARPTAPRGPRPTSRGVHGPGGQDSTPSPSRRGTASRSDRPLSRPEDAAQGVPPHPGHLVEGEHPVTARAERIEVDHEGRPASRGHLSERARQGGRAGAARAPDHPDERRRRRDPPRRGR